MSLVMSSLPVAPETISAWARNPQKTDEQRQSVNRFPDFVRHLVQRLKVICPAMGRTRIADTLAREGLHLAATTVERILDEPTPPTDHAPTTPDTETRVVRLHGVKAKCRDHVWHADLTLVPTSGGFALPWLPFALLQCWPFCYWILAVVDQFSRSVVGVAIYLGQPTSEQVCSDLDRLISIRGVAPKYIISDKGPQFDCDNYRDWCEHRHGSSITPRFGAVGKKASIAIVERFILSLKEECIRHISVPMSISAMQTELNLFVFWYNTSRFQGYSQGYYPSHFCHQDFGRDGSVSSGPR